MGSALLPPVPVKPGPGPGSGLIPEQLDLKSFFGDKGR